jgi:hypothetical protein
VNLAVSRPTPSPSPRLTSADLLREHRLAPPGRRRVRRRSPSWFGVPSACRPMGRGAPSACGLGASSGRGPRGKLGPWPPAGGPANDRCSRAPRGDPPRAVAPRTEADGQGGVPEGRWPSATDPPGAAELQLGEQPGC